MLKQIKQLAGETAIYGISSIVTKFITIFLVPIYAKIFEPSDFGTISLINITFSLLGIFVILGLDTATGVYFYELESEDRKKPISSWFWTQITISLLIFTLVTIFADQISNLILNNTSGSIYFMLAAFNLILATLPGLIINWFRLQRRPIPCIIFTLGNSLLLIFLNIVFVILLKVGIKGIFISYVLSSGISAIVAFFYIRDWIKFSSFDFSLLKKMLQFSLPLVPAAIAFWVLTSSAGYFIESKLDRAEVGLFQIGSSFASGMFLITGAFQLSWGPFAFSIHKEENARQIYAEVFIIYIVLTSFIFVCLSTFAKEILLVLTTPNYVEAYIVGSILAFNFILVGLNYIAAIGLNLAKTNSPYATAIIVASVITIGLYFLLIPALGKEGAALATLSGQILIPIYMFYKAQRLYFIPYKFSKGFLILVLAILTALFGNLVDFESMLVTVQIKILIILFYAVILLFINKKVFLSILAKLKMIKKNAYV
ncbi:flippase [soil metagenome]